MPTLVGFGAFTELPQEQISEKISRRILSGAQGMVVWWSIGAGVHVEPHSHTNEQIVWMLRGAMEFRLGVEQRVCGQGDVVVIPSGVEHERGSAKTPRSLTSSRLRATTSYRMVNHPT
jgi:quercetin dioxygenase-like cupin family protein